MTKKHFIAFAKEIKNHLKSSSGSIVVNPIVFAQCKVFADIVIKIAKADNPRFDEARFRKACGLE